MSSSTENLHATAQLTTLLPGYPKNPAHVLARARQPTHRLRLSLMLPTLLVIISSAGFGTLLLLWMLLHITQPSISSVWSDGAFIVNEGTKLEGGQEAARLVGLTISAAASYTVSITTSVLTGLFAIRVAHSWFSAMRRAETTGNDSGLPTPLQYGLIMRLLGGTSLGSLWVTVQYLCRGKGRRAPASSLLTQAFSMTVLVYVLVHAVGAFDLLLHGYTSSTLLSRMVPIDAPFPYGIAQDLCPPYPSDYTESRRCSWGGSEYGWGGMNASGFAHGMLVASNTSTSLRTITLADADNLAVLVYPNVPLDVDFQASTFGARTSCESINPLCGYADANSNCTGFPPTFPPISYQQMPIQGLDSGGSLLQIVSTNCANCTHEIADPEVDSIVAPGEAPINPTPIWLQFLWESDSDYPLYASNDAVFSYSNLATMLANCSLAFYNVTLSFSNGSYALVHEELSNTGLSDGLAGPTRLGHFSPTLISDITGHALGDNSSDSVMAFLSQDFARLALGSASAITNLTADTLSQSRVTQQLVGRYPFWPVVLVIASLYAHAALALAIFLWSVFISRSYAVCVRPDRAGPPRDYQRDEEPEDTKRDGATVSALELAHRRLTDPLAVVADLLPSEQGPAGRPAELSAKLKTLDMFAEGGSTAVTDRVCVGLHGRGGDTTFGIWARGGRARSAAWEGGDIAGDMDKDY